MSIVNARDPYDQNNIFAKIMRGEMPCNKVYEDDYAFAFHDINPQAPVHILAVPKGDYVSMADFASDAPAELIAGFFRAVGKIAQEAGLEKNGYRVIANAGPDSLQIVPHLHVHILGGRPMGRLVAKEEF